jgi:hypothetical protein
MHEATLLKESALPEREQQKKEFKSNFCFCFGRRDDQDFISGYDT